MKSIFPFSCLNPVEITLPNGDKQVVPCRRCKACIQAAAKFDTLRCDIESLSNKYQFFITLTYDRNKLPVVKYVRNFPEDSFDLQNERLNCRKNAYKVEQIDGKFRFRYIRPRGFKLREYYKRTRLRNRVGVLCKYDLQQFFKRLRNEIHRINKTQFNNFYDERIRYFAAGEYGPKTLRPHYHVILFTNSDFVSSILQQVLYKAWPYGTIDNQISEGKASDYVASYVNSRLLVPSFLNIAPFRPFKIHSRYFGETYFREEIEKVYSSPFEDFVKKMFVLHGQPITVNVWRSVQSYYFPRCLGYMYMSSESIYSLYTAYYYASRKYKENSVSELARLLYSDFDVCHGIPCLDRFMDIFRSRTNSRCGDIGNFNIDKNLYYGSMSIKDNLVLSFLYSLLYTSYRFVHLICRDNIILFKTRISVIQNYYKYVDYLALKNQLEKERDFFNTISTPFDVNDYLEYFYTNIAKNKYGTYNLYKANVKSSKIYIAYENKVNNEFENAIKHKELNDELKIWLKSNNLL